MKTILAFLVITTASVSFANDLTCIGGDFTSNFTLLVNSESNQVSLKKSGKELGTETCEPSKLVFGTAEPCVVGGYEVSVSQGKDGGQTTAHLNEVDSMGFGTSLNCN